MDAEDKPNEISKASQISGSEAISQNDGHLTSVSLEKQFWDALREIAKERGTSRQALVSTIKAERRKGNLSSAIRVFVVEHYGARLPR